MTEKLYFIDSYNLEFESPIISILENGKVSEIILEKTCFYPASGGQPADIGHINGCPVVDVRIENGKIIHTIEGIINGNVVKGVVDKKRRLDNMQQHTGQHIISQIIFQLYGKNTESLHIGRKISTIDIPIENLSEDDICSIEDKSNNIVNMNIPVITYTANNASDPTYRKKSGLKGDIRIVEIKNFDKTPCGGTHCRSTSEVGLIKIPNYYKKGALWRIEFICGMRCLKRMQDHESILRLVVADLMVPEKRIAAAVKEKLDEVKRLSKQNELLTQRLAALELDRIRKDAIIHKGCTIIAKQLDDAAVAQAMAKIVPDSQKTILLTGFITKKGATLLFACSKDCGICAGELLKVALPIIDGKGGGNPYVATGSGPNQKFLKVALDSAIRYLKEGLC